MKMKLTAQQTKRQKELDSICGYLESLPLESRMKLARETSDLFPEVCEMSDDELAVYVSGGGSKAGKKKSHSLAVFATAAVVIPFVLAILHTSTLLQLSVSVALAIFALCKSKR